MSSNRCSSGNSSSSSTSSSIRSSGGGDGGYSVNGCVSLSFLAVIITINNKSSGRRVV